MIRVLNGISVIMLLAILTALYHVRYGADGQLQAMRKVDNEIFSALKEQQVLRAEWTSLNDPVRLQNLAQTHLGLTYLSEHQLEVAVNLRQINDGVMPILRTAKVR